MKIKSILLSTTLASLGIGFLCQTATANPSLGTDYDATLVNGTTLASFTVVSEVSAVGSDYLYQYSFSGADVPTGINSLTVYFGATLANAFDLVGGVYNQVDVGSGVNWVFSGTTSSTVSFESPIAPTIGDTSAQDGGLWGNGTGGKAYGVVVPAVPDGGMTMGLMGGALLGLGALRRKIGC